MLTLARQCGIGTAESRVVKVDGNDVFLVKRFDRYKAGKGYTRARMISGLTVLQADEIPEARERWCSTTMTRMICPSSAGDGDADDRTAAMVIVEQQNLEKPAPPLCDLRDCITRVERHVRICANFRLRQNLSFITGSGA